MKYVIKVTIGENRIVSYVPMSHVHLCVFHYVTLVGLELVAILLPQLFEYCINRLYHHPGFQIPIVISCLDAFNSHGTHKVGTILSAVQKLGPGELGQTPKVELEFKGGSSVWLQPEQEQVSEIKERGDEQGEV